MRVLIFGGDGMLGHCLLQNLSLHHDVFVTLHQKLSHYESFGIFTSKNSFDNVSARDISKIKNVIQTVKPDVVINAIGLVKQRDRSKDILQSMEVNALFPQKLKLLCLQENVRFIHISTDCVFDGKHGNYSESDITNAQDIYGQTKFLGEVSGKGCLTIRTSIIGLELHRKRSLIEWFLSQTGAIKGYKNAVFTGITTLEVSNCINFLLTKQPHLDGLFHVASVPISKFELLTMLKSKLGRTDISIVENETFNCNRSLDGSHFEKITNYKIPNWHHMLDKLASEIRG